MPETATRCSCQEVIPASGSWGYEAPECGSLGIVGARPPSYVMEFPPGTVLTRPHPAPLSGGDQGGGGARAGATKT